MGWINRGICCKSESGTFDKTVLRIRGVVNSNDLTLVECEPRQATWAYCRQTGQVNNRSGGISNLRFRGYTAIESGNTDTIGKHVATARY
jgi:hypothetical protein